MKKLEHLSEIYTSYDTFIIDLWGVMHDGISLNHKAVQAIEGLLKDSKKVVFLSNAPRPSEKVKEFLREMKMKEEFLKNIVTSGEAAMQTINENKFGKFFFHLGPKRDESIFYKIKENQTSIENSDFILCTGLFDGHENDLDFYKDLLKNSLSKKLICTNPDLNVHRGEKEEHCAGAIARVFESQGGTVIYFGKPHKEIYKMCFSGNEKVLAIGDNLRTDIRGANNLNIESIFISNGVHRSEFQNENELSKLILKYKVKVDYFQPELTW
ncbi:MAG: Ribonucleotide monophosphatase NagD, HAD superfamily [Pelagibacterales bacterium]|nr:Ribonucleotide monophosphatase NagD, HAD superfamily [Pelagibacterales bacterium]